MKFNIKISTEPTFKFKEWKTKDKMLLVRRFGDGWLLQAWGFHHNYWDIKYWDEGYVFNKYPKKEIEELCTLM
jgi:hypothetical protein